MKGLVGNFTRAKVFWRSNVTLLHCPVICCYNDESNVLLMCVTVGGDGDKCSVFLQARSRQETVVHLTTNPTGSRSLVLESKSKAMFLKCQGSSIVKETNSYLN
jgi:hypothetical protein